MPRARPPKPTGQPHVRRKSRVRRGLGKLTLIFGAGLGLGLALGIWVSGPLERPHSSATLPVLPDQRADTAPRTGDGLPVRITRSEHALKDFKFEEPVNPTVPEDARRPVPLPPPATVARREVDPRPPVKPQDTGADDVASAPAGSPPKPETAPVAPVVVTLPTAAVDAPAWIRNAALSEPVLGEPMIAIVIDDLGIDQPRTARTIALKGQMTLSFIPYGYNLRDHVREARAQGHEVMLHLPMEPVNPDVDPGPNALLAGMKPDVLAQHLDWALAQFDGYVGINNHMGSRFTAWESGMRTVLERLRRNGLLFLDSITSQETVGFRLARSMGVANATRDVFLDHDMRREAIAEALAKTERIARERGYAVAIGHPHDGTIEELAVWLPTLKAKGIQLVPISTIVRLTNPSG